MIYLKKLNFINWRKAILFLSLILFSGLITKINASELKDDTLFKIKTKVFDSSVLNRKQDISIYLPDDYRHNSKKYPVVYVLDGEFLFSTAINTTRVRANRNLMPQSIIVGLRTSTSSTRMSIAMPIRRDKDDEKSIIFENGKPEQFLSFMAKELMPFIESSYRTAPHNTIIGMSPTVGVLLTDYFKDQPIFTAHIALAADPQRYTADGSSLLSKILKRITKRKNAHLYISRGELDVNRREDLKTTFAYLRKEIKKQKIERFLMAEVIVGGEHYGMSLDGINNGFRHIYPETVWRPDYLTIRKNNNPAKELKHFYQQLSKQYGFTAYPIADGYWMGLSIAGTTRYLLRNKKSKQALEMLNWAMKLQPNNIDLQYNLTSALEENLQIKQAIVEARKLIKMAEVQQHRSQHYFEDYLTELIAIK